MFVPSHDSKNPEELIEVVQIPRSWYIYEPRGATEGVFIKFIVSRIISLGPLVRSNKLYLSVCILLPLPDSSADITPKRFSKGLITDSGRGNIFQGCCLLTPINLHNFCLVLFLCVLYTQGEFTTATFIRSLFRSNYSQLRNGSISAPCGFG